MLWWHSWTWWFGTYGWLEANNLWKATVAFFVTLILAGIVTAALRPWRRWKDHQQTQKAIADRLDTDTPGGLTDLVDAIQAVIDELRDTQKPESGDDNGSDDRRHVLHAERSEHLPGIHGVIPRGGGGATHR